MHVVVILYLIRHKISFPFSHLMTVRYKGYVTDLEEYIRSLTRDHILLRDREDILIWNFAPVGTYTLKSGYTVLSGMGLDREVVWW